MTDSSYYMHGEHITPTQPSTQDKRKCTPGGNATAPNAIKIYFSFMLFDEKKGNIRSHAAPIFYNFVFGC